jgi:glycosyltransferase involved in cell wall biosynthesis
MIEDISFIVIARNEEFGVEKCLDSLALLPLKNCEIICVDSDSEDATACVMKRYHTEFSSYHVLRCSGFVNAAVARNVGLRCASKEYIFFVDGDVELVPDFIPHALRRIQSGKADAVTGKLTEIQYLPGFRAENRRLIRRAHMTKEKRCLMTGGIFLATRDIVNRVGEWDTSFVRSQDLDYTLRITRYGTLIQLPMFIGIHHTLGFNDRSWEYYRKGYAKFYGRLLRKHVNRPRLAFGILRRNRGLFTFLLFCVVLFFALAGIGLSFWSWRSAGVAVVICVLMDLFYSTILKGWRVDHWCVHNFLTPPLILGGILIGPTNETSSTEVERIL